MIGTNLVVGQMLINVTGIIGQEVVTVQLFNKYHAKRYVVESTY